jgi:hypothetical protein
LGVDWRSLSIDPMRRRIDNYFVSLFFCGSITGLFSQILPCSTFVKPPFSANENDRIVFKSKPHAFDDSIKQAAVIALSFYTELAQSKITFQSKKIKTTMNARPTFGSVLFRKPSNYRYVVRINSRERDSVIQVKNIPFDALIGVFGHEFCHFIDYRTHKKSHLVKRAFDYGSKKRKETFEKEIDRMALSRGLGCHLYKWSTYVLFDSNAKASYKSFKQTTYLQPHEILELMHQ